MQENKIWCDEDGTMHDDRVLSYDPKDWDLVKDLNLTYVGYYDLPDFYLEIRDELPSKSEKEFFIDGMFINAQPGEMPADVYLRYEERKEQDPTYKQWRDFGTKTLFQNLETIRGEHGLKNPNRSYRQSAKIKAAEEITPRFLQAVQNTGIVNKNINRKSLQNSNLQQRRNRTPSQFFRTGV
jgi:hypothetical protein